MMYKRWIIILLLVTTLVSCRRSATPTPTPIATAPSSGVGARSIGGTVSASGKVMPARNAALSLPTDGVVSEVLVAEGDEVEAGQVLVRLEATQQKAAVAQAEAGLRRAQVQLDELKAGPRPQEIEAAQAAVEAAQAGLARLTEETPPEEVAAARAALASAQASLQHVQKGPDEDEITVAAVDLRRAEISLKQAQGAYDQVAYADDVGDSPQAAQLEQATLDYQAALAHYHLAVRGPTDADVAAARAQLAQAEASLAQLLQGAREAAIAGAKAEIRRAQAQLNLIQAGARPEDIAAAETEVTSAEATLTEARSALADTELRAPFAGTVTALEASPGEAVSPLTGQTVLTLADLSCLQVETTDLSERDVARVKVGQNATAFVQALGQDIEGTVVHIASQANTVGGDVVYKVVIELNQQPPELRWGMSVDVEINTE
jgi:HlyD family secretion protein